MAPDPSWLLVPHAVSSLVMVGIIWFVQVVHYPMFAHVGALEFAAWEQRNTRLTTFVVGPPMLVEAASAAGLLVLRAGRLSLGGAVLLAVIWVSTFAIQVPAHGRLERGFDASVHRRLVSTNWIRTVCWTLRGALSVVMLLRG